MFYFTLDCGQPPTPGHGKVSYSSGTTYGMVATYTCNTGYDLIGQTSVTCQNNGTWTNIPVCRPKGNLNIYTYYKFQTFIVCKDFDLYT